MIDGALRRRDVDVAFVLAVRGADVDQIAEGHRRRVREVVGIGADFLHHVERPDHVGVGHPGQFLVLRAVVLVVAKPLDVDAEQHAAVAHVVEPFADHHRRGGHALEGPVVGAARFELRVRVLPQELAGGLTERHQHTAVARLLRVAHQLVVGADKDHAAGDHRVAVALRAEIGDPLHVLLGLHVPVERQPLHRRHHVAAGRAAPHRPVAAGRGRGLGAQRHRAGHRRRADDGRRQRRAKSSLNPLGHGSSSGGVRASSKTA